jgi:hypothetical protein
MKLKKNYKKSLFLTGAFFAFMLFFVGNTKMVFAAGDSTLSFAAPLVQTVSVGQDFTIGVNVSAGTYPVSNIDLFFNYDRTYLQLTSIVLAGSFTASATPTIPADGTGTATAFIPADLPLGQSLSGTGSFATLHFHAKTATPSAAVNIDKVLSGVYTDVLAQAGINQLSNAAISPAGATIVAPDVTVPTVDAFVIPATATSLTVPITTFTASDNTAVTGYLLTESATAPAASDAGWQGTAPTNYVFSTQGIKTLYAWAKDAAGNVSTNLSDSVTITLPTYTVSATISGLNGSVSLGGTIGGTPWQGTFTTNVSHLLTSGLDGAAYTVNVTAQPTGQTCTVGNGSTGTISGADVSLTVSCADDTVAPVRTNGKPSGEISNDSTTATMSLNTDEIATCKYATASGADFASMTAFSTTAAMSHATLISDLVQGNDYHFYVKCQDVMGNTNVDDMLISFSVDIKKGDNDNKKEDVASSRAIHDSQTIVKKGKILVQSGKNFSKNSEVLLYFSKPGGGYYAPTKITTRSNGTFYLTYKVSKPVGKYSWYAVDTKTGKKSKSTTYRVR